MVFRSLLSIIFLVLAVVPRLKEFWKRENERVTDHRSSSLLLLSGFLFLLRHGLRWQMLLTDLLARVFGWLWPAQSTPSSRLWLHRFPSQCVRIIISVTDFFAAGHGWS